MPDFIPRQKTILRTKAGLMKIDHSKPKFAKGYVNDQLLKSSEERKRRIRTMAKRHADPAVLAKILVP